MASKRPWRLYRRNSRFDKPDKWYLIIGVCFADRSNAIAEGEHEHRLMNGDHHRPGEGRWQHRVRNIDTGEIAWSSETEASDGK